MRSLLYGFGLVGLLFNALLAVQQTRTYRRLPQSERDEAFGYSFDPVMARWIAVLGVGELLVFVDYGYWRLVPALLNSWLQSIGVVLAVPTLAWVVWIDSYLVVQFAAADRSVMARGPYRYLRHPRYLGLILSRVATALLFASIIGWILLVGWIAVVIRRIGLEERHLDAVFRDSYSTYARTKARLIPGLY